MDPRKIGQFLMGEWDKTSQPLKERASVLPLGQYEDGSVGLAWPGILAAPAEGVMNFGSQGYGEEAVPYNSRMAFDAAGGAMTGGLGVGLAGGMVDNAVGSAGAKITGNALERAQPQGIRAYHGSPHDFDRFSLDKIGTGEGAQAYGHGLYFAGSEDVARYYKETLSKNTFIDGLPVNAPDAPFKWMSSYYRDGITDARDIEKALRNDIDVETKRAAELEQSARSGPKNSRGFAQSYAKEARSRAAAKQTQLSELQEHLKTNPGAIANNVQGRMYEVNIKANPEDFLDWDKPLSQQSKKVRGVVDKMRGASSMVDRKIAGEPSGQAIWEAMRNGFIGKQLGYEDWSTAGPTKALREAGIPGIKYLDGMSRDGGAGTSNYVVFDDALIDILRKYANAPTGAAIPLGMEGQEQDPALIEYLKAIGLY